MWRAGVHLIYRFMRFSSPPLIQTLALFKRAHICVIALCSRSAPPLITRTNEQERSSASLHLRLFLTRLLLTEQKPLAIPSRRGPFHLSQDLEMRLFHVINDADGDGKNRLLPSVLEVDLGTGTPDLHRLQSHSHLGHFTRFEAETEQFPHGNPFRPAPPCTALLLCHCFQFGIAISPYLQLQFACWSRGRWRLVTRR